MKTFESAGESGAPAIVPRIAICAFFESEDVGTMLYRAQHDRRMGRAHLDVFEGGIAAATERFRTFGSPNLVVVEWQEADAELFVQLERLAQECPHGTRVLVIGHRNDVSLYRALLSRGVSDYAVAPVTVVDFCTTVARIYSDSASKAIGSTIAFIGASGGVGSSTIAHNVAWTMAAELDMDALLVDTDIAFGTAGLNFNLEAKHQGVLDALQPTGKLDDEMVDKLVAKPHARLSVLSAPATLQAGYELEWSHFERAVEIARARPGYTLFDIPHTWNTWVRELLKSVDQVVITARPDLSNLRNCKNMLAYIEAVRPNDAAPKLVLNQVGVPRRTEIKLAEFSKAMTRAPDALLAYDPVLFGTAANNGQLIAQVAASNKAGRVFEAIAASLVSRPHAGTGSRKPGLAARLLGRRQ